MDMPPEKTFAEAHSYKGGFDRYVFDCLVALRKENEELKAEIEELKAEIEELKP